LTKFKVHTYGCQMNERDSETLAGLLLEAGYDEAGPGDDADVVVFNTCCVRESAERKIFGKANEYRVMRRRHHTALALTGCLCQQPGALERIRKALPHVNIVLGTHNLNRLPEAVHAVTTTGRPFFEVLDAEVPIGEGMPARRPPGLTAWVTIMYGCNNFCSYCIVPYVRGRERSRDPQDIVNEVRGLVAQGYREITLLGQNVNSYGKTLSTPMDFSDLLERLEGVDGLLRVRFMTSHPRDYSLKLIETIAQSKKVCEHVHLPVQSGSNRILGLMNRGYTVDYYKELVERTRDRIPGVSITTDIIVGFPGETEADFRDTMSLVNEVRFDAAFTFVYSDRSGTKASVMEDQVPQETKDSRITELVAVQNDITQKINKTIVGKVQEVLVEGTSPKAKDKLTGRTRTDRVVNFDDDGHVPGDLVMVKISSAGTFTLRGEIIGR
jgi:tRNA-2-methylthio-N6-dimethylallyladenosine synthase